MFLLVGLAVQNLIILKNILSSLKAWKLIFHAVHLHKLQILSVLGLWVNHFKRTKNAPKALRRRTTQVAAGLAAPPQNNVVSMIIHFSPHTSTLIIVLVDSLRKYFPRSLNSFLHPLRKWANSFLFAPYHFENVTQFMFVFQMSSFLFLNLKKKSQHLGLLLLRPLTEEDRVWHCELMNFPFALSRLWLPSSHDEMEKAMTGMWNLGCADFNT